MLPVLLLFLAPSDVSFSPARLEKDLLGYTVSVDKKDWTFSNSPGDHTKVKTIKGFTVTPRKLSVDVELDCHLC
jgi:hypothetical protein